MNIISNSLTITVLGLIAGSFINMASYRLTLKGSTINNLLLRRSFCPKCKKNLTTKNLVPLFSWLFQKGKCSFCSAPIPLRYPLIEIFTAITFIIIYWQSGSVINFKLITLLLISVILIIMVVTDLEHYFIPDCTQIILLILGIIYHFAANNINDFWYYLGSGFALCLFGFMLDRIFLFITGKHGLGIDDIKFFAVSGFIIGLNQLAVFMLFSGLFGTLFGAIWQKLRKDNTFPFAPALTIALMICLLFNGNPYFDLLIPVK